MDKNFTYHHLILGLYDSLKPDTHTGLQNALKTNTLLHTEYEQLQEGKNVLDRIVPAEPSQSSRDTILNYAVQVEEFA